MTPEFSRPHRLDRIGAGESQAAVSAGAAERAALARRFGLEAIEALDATYTLRRSAGGVHAAGHLAARVTQSCIVTGDPVPARIEEDFELRFVPEPESASDEIELSADECDTVFFSGAAIDLGEAAAETLALALDPFPRSPAAAEALRRAGVLSEEEASSQGAASGPFGALAALKGKTGS